MDTEGVKKLLRDVVKLLEEGNVPQDVRPVAFEQLWRSLSGAEPRAEPTAVGAPAGEPIQKLARRLKTDAAPLVDLYEAEEDGVLRVVVPSNLLPEPKAVAQRELALLVCAGRQATVEDATPAAAIKEACQQYGKLDSPNFAANMKAGEKWWIESGPAQKRTYKLRTTGWEAATALVVRLAGTE